MKDSLMFYDIMKYPIPKNKEQFSLFERDDLKEYYNKK
jgi:hypothetical protein